ncbi:MAG: glycyl radical protein, partial [Candidatus Aminicenantes bacterium]|nr:glycyl radical protein [Candidatus Aminicenantes bacterium]
MNERIKNLRSQSLKAKPSISPERAKLITEFYMSPVGDQVSPPVRRALSFKYILEKKKIWIGKGELIVGERGPAPMATPTYPEITAHSLKDLDVLNSRKKTSFKVDSKTRKIYREEVLPFWKGRSIRDRIFKEMSEAWKNAYEAGVFTEFMEQRAPGHTVLDDKIYKKGFLEFKEEIDSRIQDLDFLNDSEAYYKREELKAMGICLDALIAYAERHARKAKELSEKEENKTRKKELNDIARICRHVPSHAPRTFREALQYYWFVHLGVIIELNTWDSFNPGRLDQHLYPFFKREVEEGRLSTDEAKELLQAFWIKFNNQPAPPKVGVTAEESGTYTDFALINTGGVRPDGSDAVNEVSFLILDVIEEMRLLQPSSMIQISKKSPERFLKRALKIVKTGFGQPSIFNTDAIVQELVRQGKSIEDARNGGTSGCVEAGAFGKENYTLTGYFNLTKVFEITMNNGIDPKTGKKIGLETGNPVKFKTYRELHEAYKRQIKHFVDIKIEGNSIIERLYAECLPAPFLSLLIDDCVVKGKDYHEGGARYNSTYIQGVGIGTMTDVLASVKYNVFDQKYVTMKELLSALEHNFRRYENLRHRFLNKTPKYGNDDDYADQIMTSIFNAYYDAVNGRPNTKNGHYRINMLPTTVHVYFGRMVGATADGRKDGEPLSEGVSPVQGADRQGPTAVIKSVAKMDHVRTGGTLLNQKFTPHLLADKDGIDKLASLIRSYFKLDGHHIQLNVVSGDTLRDAQL